MIQDKYIGLSLAVSSSLAIGASFIITKKGLISAAENNGFTGNDFGYLKNPIWWAGMCTMIVGEVANFAAYTFAPAILVTPLGALSVLIGSVLASLFLKESLGRIGKIGCALCLVGAIIIVLHAPPDKDVQTVDEILSYALRPLFLIYAIGVLCFSIYIIYWIAPYHGRSNPLVYISVCSLVGSISIMAIKGFGIALKLTLAGNNQLTHVSTYVFAVVVVICIITQMNYFNKALDQFDSSIVNPVYYVTFTTSTLVASFIMFQGFNTSNAVDICSLFCGFLVIFSGVYLLNIVRLDNSESAMQVPDGISGMPMDNGIGSFQTRRKSMQLSRDAQNDSRANYSGHKYLQIPKQVREEDDETVELREQTIFNAEDEIARQNEAQKQQQHNPTMMNRDTNRLSLPSHLDASKFTKANDYAGALDQMYSPLFVNNH